jgi:hypothetical protein
LLGHLKQGLLVFECVGHKNPRRVSRHVEKAAMSGSEGDSASLLSATVGSTQVAGLMSVSLMVSFV